MLGSIIKFELKYQLTSPVFIAAFTIFFLLTFGGVTIDQIQVGSTGAVNVNSPHAISQNILIWSLFGIFLPTAFLVSGILRDAAYKTEELFFSSPVKEKDYLLGRFVGGFVATVLAFMAVPLAILIGSMMPWLDPENVGPLVLSHYFYTFFIFGVLNLLVAGLFMFTVANLTRSNATTYAALVGLLILYFVGSALLTDPEYRQLVSIADPFAVNTYFEMVRYWTPFEMNAETVPFEGNLLINRILWLGVAIALFLFNLTTFSFRKRASWRPFARKKKVALKEEAFVPVHIELPKALPLQGIAVDWRQFMSRVMFEVMGVVKSVAFWILLVLGLLNAIGALMNMGAFFGTPVYPVTRLMINLVTGTFTLVPMIVVVYYAAELIWRERNVQFSDIVDATPTPSWVFIYSKFIAMVVVLMGLFIVSLLGAVGVQTFRGYTDYEFDQYLVRLFVDFGIPFAMIAALSIFAQVLTNNRWLGMLVMVIYIISTFVLANMGYEDYLYRFGQSPGAPYSDMNGYGHFMAMTLWFHLYWGLFSIVLLVFAYLLWNRGSLTSIWKRLVALPRAMTPTTAIILMITLGGFAATGKWIHHNTHVLNEYITQKDQERLAATYEKTYRELEDVVQPKITDVYIDVDIFPYERRYGAEGSYVLVNKSDAPIDTVYVGYGLAATPLNTVIEGASLANADEDFSFYEFRFDEPLQPGAQTRLSFKVEVTNPGFRNSGNVATVNYNGTFFNNTEAMPYIGFSRDLMLQDKQARRRQDLDPIERLPELENEEEWYKNPFTPNSDYVTFKTTVSTSEDQIAIAPGYLQNEWVEDGRRFFTYEMTAPILNFYAWLSADYEVREEWWNDVVLQIFYHEPHDFNLDNMFKGMSDSLTYFTENFSPYQHKQMRILEFPAYQTFAQSFPNTVPFSEGIGFIADLRDPDDLDYVYYVTSHEVAHQWWAHQVISGNVQGATMIVESFSQYSALMVMEKEFGPDHMRRFLKHELDNYLASRGSEEIEETPLYRVENQGYIRYQKGSLAMYALKDYVGEATVNRALQRLIEEKALVTDPYPTTLDFMRLIREEAGAEYEELITDLFEKIVIFDLKVGDATKRKLDDGSWEVTATIDAAKYEADGLGRQTKVPLDYMIDVGVFTQNLDGAIKGTDHVLHMKKHRVNSDQLSLTVIVDKEPLYVGIDPYNKLIDRNSDDNLKRLQITDDENS